VADRWLIEMALVSEVLDDARGVRRMAATRREAIRCAHECWMVQRESSGRARLGYGD
jgi:hypothetical protein